MGRKVFKSKTVKKIMQQNEESEKLVERIIIENIDVLKAIGELDRNFGENRQIAKAGEKAEGMAGTTSTLVQEIYTGI